MIKLLILPLFGLMALIPGQEIIIENTYQNNRIVIAEVTAYTSSKYETDNSPWLTAAQTATREGVIACPRHIPFFTMIEIDGKAYSCEDRMNLKHPDRWDIWFESRAEALEWGIQDKLIKIYEN